MNERPCYICEKLTSNIMFGDSRTATGIFGMFSIHICEVCFKNYEESGIERNRIHAELERQVTANFPWRVH